MTPETFWAMTLEEFDLALYGYQVEQGNEEEMRSLRGARFIGYLNHINDFSIKPKYKELDLIKFFRLPGEPNTSLTDQIETDDSFIEE